MEQYSTFIFIALLVLAFYFLILRPQRKRQQALQQTMNAISPGSRVMLGSGLFGTVVSVGPRQVVLEISPGAEITVLKQAISKIVSDDDEDRLDEQDEFDEQEDVTATDEPIELPSERPIEEPTTATSTEPDSSPARDSSPTPHNSSPTPRDSSPAPRDSKPPIAD
jgi:preprotein translocase subunit YajC